jgi:hypothetical protein
VSAVSESTEREQIRKDFEGAIARLQAGLPSNRELKQLNAKGRLRFNFSVVATEAGRSRTLIAHKNCAYPEIRKKVLDLCRPEDRAMPRTASDSISRLREQVKSLAAERDAALDMQHATALLLEEAQRRAARAEALLLRRKVHAAEAAKVVPLYPPIKT